MNTDARAGGPVQPRNSSLSRTPSSLRPHAFQRPRGGEVMPLGREEVSRGWALFQGGSERETK